MERESGGGWRERERGSQREEDGERKRVRQWDGQRD